MATNQQMSFAKFTPARKAKYLDALREGLTLGRAAKKAGVSHQLVWLYRKMQTPDAKAFAAAADLARDEGIDAQTSGVENSLLKQALRGNVTAIQVWLYNRRPDRWRDQRNFEIKGLDDVLKLLLPPGVARQLGAELRRILDASGVDGAGGPPRPQINGRS